MKPTFTRDATHDFAPPGNWDEEKNGPCGHLHVRAEGGLDHNPLALVSTWKPSVDDIAAIIAGGVIEIGLLQPTQPVMFVQIVDPVDVVRVDDHKREASRPALTINEDAHGFSYDEHGVSTP